MGSRRDKIEKRNAHAVYARRTNSTRKEAERARRDQTMLSLIRKGQFPYTPGVMSWLSTRLGKKSSRITPADVEGLLG